MEKAEWENIEKIRKTWVIVVYKMKEMEGLLLLTIRDNRNKELTKDSIVDKHT